MLLGQDDLVTASTAALGRNTEELVERIGPLAGPEVGERFRTAWDRHVEVLGQGSTARRPLPARLRISSLQVDAPAGPVGTLADRSVEVPERWEDVGWYDG